MQKPTIALAAVILAVCLGCDYRVLDPTWRSLGRKNVGTVPGDFHDAGFDDGFTDEQFAAAVPDLKRVGIRHLNFQDTQITDRSIDGLLQLRKLETVSLHEPIFTVDGLVRLAALPRLRKLAVPQGRYSDEELNRLQAALPNASVKEW